MLKKISILAILLIITIGFVSAVEFQVPDGFTKQSDELYTTADNKENINIINFEKEKDFWLENNTEDKYTVVGAENNTYNFTDGMLNDVGVLEVVEVDGEKYIINFWTDEGTDNDRTDNLKQMLEFNKLNKLEPLAV